MTKLCNLKKNHACSPFLCSRFPKMWTIGGQDLEKISRMLLLPQELFMSPPGNESIGIFVLQKFLLLNGSSRSLEYKNLGPSMLIFGRVLQKLLLSSRSSPHGMASQLIGSFPYLASNWAGHQSPRGRQKHKGLSIFKIITNEGERAVPKSLYCLTFIMSAIHHLKVLLQNIEKIWLQLRHRFWIVCLFLSFWNERAKGCYQVVPLMAPNNTAWLV